MGLHYIHILYVVLVRCCGNFLNKILKYNVKIRIPKLLHDNILL
jgi:hypothetical protein